MKCVLYDLVDSELLAEQAITQTMTAVTILKCRRRESRMYRLTASCDVVIENELNSLMGEQ